MTFSNTLRTSSISLSSDAAVEAILADIPLFCEGIMGIGVFTFLVVAKQVKWPSAFLYASSFLTFAAATLDLSQILVHGPGKVSNDGTLQSLTGFIISREIFLSLSILALNLYYWRLVALCPRPECSNTRILSFSNTPRPHSASWNRWGTLGVVLKWFTLAALLSVPLLETLWRLLPDQRRYSSFYVADAVIQTTIISILILKCGLNIYLSPSAEYWKASRMYIAPVAALSFGVGLAIGNLVVFAFTETTLGRLLRAVEVYILFLNNLNTTFMFAIDAAQPLIAEVSHEISPWDPEKSASHFRAVVSPNYDDRSVPSVIEIGATPGYQARAIPLRSKTPSWMSMSTNQSMSRRVEADVQSKASEVVTGTPQLVQQNGPLQSGTPVIVRNPIGIFGAPPRTPEPIIERPFTTTSYYSSEPSSPKRRAASPPISASPIDIATAYGVSPPRSPERSLAVIYAEAQALSPFDSQPGSQQGSITSFDELVRQQNELDKSIAALRLLSTQSMVTSVVVTPDEEQPGGESSSYPSKKSVLTNSFSTSKGDGSPSRSEFSLSIFPEPPLVKSEDTSREIPTAPPVLRRKAFTDSIPPPLQIVPESATVSSATLSQLNTGNERFNSAGTQYDVTSFIGDLSGAPASSVLMQRTSQGELIPYSAEPVSTTAATIGSAVTLRPMILASAIYSANAEPSGQAPEALPSAGADSPLPLRPLLLGRPMGSVAPLPLPGRMVPLAQRRERGGTIASATRRPYIGTPRLNEDSDSAPDAFERPRPPPLIIK
ncbi:hypothetical protein CPB83DRAFT_56342 [Crepidotus variabilis]|uniref:Uncharacterized protein n=1 Tax=Crepidotus variabilis TaxID=179855 RepID=A0A9P6EMX1_9AGAR|nr:hypothetical protein CPB83DRAFT_56342 [Crepidotus variabilis]